MPFGRSASPTRAGERSGFENDPAKSEDLSLSSRARARDLAGGWHRSRHDPALGLSGLPHRLAAGLGALTLAASVLSPVALAADRPAVLFDESHDQRFRVGGDGPLDLSRFAATVRGAGGQVEAVTSPLLAATLAPAEVVVVSGAFKPLGPEEIDAVVGFVERGGRLAVLLHIGPPVADLLHRLGVSISNGVIREGSGAAGSDPINFAVTRMARHPLTAGLASFALFGAWALLPTAPGVVAIAETGPAAWVDLNRSGTYERGDAMQSFAVVVAGERGKGRFVVFGDDAIFQNQILADNPANRRLAENLAHWLVERSPGAPLAMREAGVLEVAAR